MRLKIGILITLALFLSACQADTSVLLVDPESVIQQATDLQSSENTNVDEDADVKNNSGGMEEADGTGQDEIAEDAEASTNVESEKPMFETVEVPLVDLGNDWFQPVNPLGVNISSGEYQLFEFSAFW